MVGYFKKIVIAGIVESEMMELFVGGFFLSVVWSFISGALTLEQKPVTYN